jgi:hypothetical protein
MINEELTASGRVKGDLVLDPELRKILRVGLSRMAWLRRMGLGPPSFRRPGSNRWMTWRGEILDYLESDRSLPAAPSGRHREEARSQIQAGKGRQGGAEA